jgi:gliding motility-associated-like protein
LITKIIDVKNLILSLIFLCLSLNLFSQSGDCATAASFCTDVPNYTFNNQTNNGDLGSVHCLDSSPNPVWYYMTIDNSGPMEITISQQDANGNGIDVDFALWGPFNSLASACGGTGNNPVDCSFSPSATETATIPNAQVGQTYLLLLTNYSNQPGTIEFGQTSGSASADCSFVCGVTGFTAIPTACSGNSVYTLNGTLSITNPPTSGTLTISSSCGGTQTFNAPFANTINYTLPNLTANGAACTVSTSFSANSNCNTTEQYTAPAPCAPACAITGVTAVPGQCASATNTFGLTGTVSFTNAPTTGTLTVTSSCGGTQTLNPPFNSPMNYTLAGLTANGGACTVTASFSATTCTGTQNFTAPAACGCVISNLTAVPSACANDLYNVTGAITFSAAPATGTLTVSGCGGTQTFNAPFVSPLNYTFNGLTANGANCNVTATFSALPGCTRTQAYSAPAACLNPPCVQNPFCADPNNPTTFPAGTNQIPASTTYPNNDYGCLGSTPNPEWYYMQIGNSGSMDIVMGNSANVDIDFILYGPYSSYNNALTYCDDFGTATTGSNTNLIVDCSFSGSANETANIANAQTGEVYVLLITNFSNQPTNISFNSSGTATTDCSIVTPCIAEIGTFNPNLTGDTQSQTMLCFGDQLNITSNNDFVTPALVTGGTAPEPVYDPGVSWLVYSCPPTVALTPAQSAATQLTLPDDPCFLGIYANTPNLTDVNDMSIINGQPAGTFTNNTVYFVPVTMYSLVEGLYSYVISPANDCYELGTPVAIQYLPEIVAVQNPNCANGTVAVTLTGGAPQVNGTNFNVVTGSQSPASATFLSTSVPNGGTIILGNLTDGPYSFDIVDDNGCPITISGDYVGPQSATITYPDNLYCLNEANPTPSLVGNAGGTYTSGNGLSINAATGQINLATSTPGAYAITYTTPGNQCPATSTFNLTIEDFPIVDAGPDLTVCVGKPIILSGSGASSYSWNNGLQNNVPYLPNFGLTQFVVIGTSSGGCIGTDSLTVTVIGDCDSTIDVIFWVPNTFTPDGDQYNQTFSPVFNSGFDPYSFDFYVYNRWGELIWESHDATVGWDGAYGDGLQCPDGTYTWKIRFKLLNNDERQTVLGHVNLIR